MEETQNILRQMGFKNLNNNVWESDWFGVFILLKTATPDDLAKFIFNRGKTSKPEGKEIPVGAEAFVESCANLTEYVNGTKIAHRFKKWTIPVIEFNELREAAKKWDKQALQSTQKAEGGSLPTNKEIFEWLLQKKYQTADSEQEYKMYFDVDMPKILRQFLIEHCSQSQLQSLLKEPTTLRDELIRFQIWCETSGQMFPVDEKYCKEVVDNYLNSKEK